MCGRKLERESEVVRERDKERDKGKDRTRDGKCESMKVLEGERGDHERERERTRAREWEVN